MRFEYFGFFMANYVQFIVCKVLDVKNEISISSTNDCYLGQITTVSKQWLDIGHCIEELEFES